MIKTNKNPFLDGGRGSEGAVPLGGVPRSAFWGVGLRFENVGFGVLGLKLGVQVGGSELRVSGCEGSKFEVFKI